MTSKTRESKPEHGISRRKTGGGGLPGLWNSPTFIAEETKGAKKTGSKPAPSGTASEQVETPCHSCKSKSADKSAF
jgi:hypothetical protein